MRLYPILGIVALVACADPDMIGHVCPNPEPCIVGPEGQVLTDVAGLGVGLLKFRGVCHSGLTACDGSGEITGCMGYGAPSDELCDSLDNDCDGETDEGFDQDADGYTMCHGDCDDLDPARNPGESETCDNVDNDCDGSIDGYERPCWDGSHNALRVPPAVCRDGHTTCIAGRWTPCAGGVDASIELCDGLDNDCDGEVDEPTEHACGFNDVGACRKGDYMCTPDHERVCVNAFLQTFEVCNGIDDDCDGDIDEDVERACETACGKGKQVCADGQWSPCDARQPTHEICNDLDDDCDGEIDEGCPCSEDDTMLCRRDVIDRITGEPLGCGVGVSICDSTGKWGPCYYLSQEPERCDGWDNDCDGAIDGFEQYCGPTLLDGVGQCKLGHARCDAGQWAPCVDAVFPSDEVCNGKDDDCDGETDEGIRKHEVVDMCFFIDGSSSMCGVIDAVKDGIAAYVDEFKGTEHRFCLGVFPGVGGFTDADAVDMLTGDSSSALVGLGELRTALSGLDCDYGGWEPSYDAAYLAATPDDQLHVGWRGTGSSTVAYPYIIIVTDEPADSFVSRAEWAVAKMTHDCRVGACRPGDPFEVYVITPSAFFSMWDDVVLNDPKRLIEMYPADADRYVTVLKGIFTNVCR